MGTTPRRTAGQPVLTQRRRWSCASQTPAPASTYRTSFQTGGGKLMTLHRAYDTLLMIPVPRPQGASAQQRMQDVAKLALVSLTMQVLWPPRSFRHEYLGVRKGNTLSSPCQLLQGRWCWRSAPCIHACVTNQVTHRDHSGILRCSSAFMMNCILK